MGGVECELLYILVLVMLGWFTRLTRAEWVVLKRRTMEVKLIIMNRQIILKKIPSEGRSPKLNVQVVDNGIGGETVHS